MAEEKKITIEYFEEDAPPLTKKQLETVKEILKIGTWLCGATEFNEGEA